MNRHLESHCDLRGHRFSLYQSQIHHYDTRIYNFTNRIISIWNGLPDTVISATVDTFNDRLDRFWQNQEVIYNWKTDIHIGSRS